MFTVRFKYICPISIASGDVAKIFGARFISHLARFSNRFQISVNSQVFTVQLLLSKGILSKKLSKTGSSENIEILQTLWCQRSLDLLREVQIKFVSSKSFHSGSIPRISFWSVPDTNFDVIYLLKVFSSSTKVCSTLSRTGLTPNTVRT